MLMTKAENAPCIVPGYRLVPSPYAVSHAQVTAAYVFVPVDAASLQAERAACAALRTPQLATPFRLKVLHINDLHGQIVRHQPHGRLPVFSHLVWRLRQLRLQAEGDPRSAVLFVSSGDDSGGSLFDALLKAEDLAGHAVYRAYSAAGLDVAVLGNHDFDAGPDALARALQQDVAFPVLAANVQAPPALQRLLSPAAILLVKGLRIGVIGVTTPAQKNNSALRVSDPRPVVRELAAALRPWCDVLILLSHLGYALGAETASVRLAGDRELAACLPTGALQAIIGGHTHQALNEDGLCSANVANGIPILQAGMFGRFLGEATIKVNGRAALSDARLQRTADLPLDEAFEEAVVRPLVAGVENALQRPLGRVATLPDFTAEAVRNDFAAGESAFANFITDALVARLHVRGLPVDLALLDAIAVHDGLAPGRPLTLQDWLRVMPYADTVRLLRLSGRQLWCLLQDNALRIDLPHEPHVERGFLQFSEALRYAVRVTEERAALRAADILLGGVPLSVQMEREFVLALSSFVRAKARPWETRVASRLPIDAEALPLARARDTGLFLREEVLAVIREQGGVDGQRDGRLRVLAVPARQGQLRIHAAGLPAELARPPA